jgi:hypothetical protein
MNMKMIKCHVKQNVGVRKEESHFDKNVNRYSMRRKIKINSLL